jgi:hypothetical protein
VHLVSAASEVETVLAAAREAVSGGADWAGSAGCRRGFSRDASEGGGGGVALAFAASDPPFSEKKVGRWAGSRGIGCGVRGWGCEEGDQFNWITITINTTRLFWATVWYLEVRKLHSGKALVHQSIWSFEI